MKIYIANHEHPIIYDGVYYFALSDYPRITAWELKKLLAFMDYEKSHGRPTEIICVDESILSAVTNTVANPETVKNSPLPAKITECTYCNDKGCITRFVCHTTTIENAKKILMGGKLLSSVKATGKTANELVIERSQSLCKDFNDPADYYEYIMFTWGNCQAGDRIVMEKKLERYPNEDDLSTGFAPGTRFYFQYDDIIRHPGYVFDGSHPVKIKDEIVLSDYMYVCIVPGQYESELKKLINPEIADKIYYIPQNGLGLLDWSEKVYGFIEGLDL